jgi:hypothetical protein
MLEGQVSLDRPWTVNMNGHPVSFSPGRFFGRASWLIATVVGLFVAFSARSTWKEFSLYFYSQTTADADPIFHRPISFYLFTLPLYEIILSWLFILSVLILIVSIAVSLLPAGEGKAQSTSLVRPGPVSAALGFFLCIIAGRISLSRFPLLWQDHPSFTGVTFTEAHYLIPALSLLAVVVLLCGLTCFLNAIVFRRLWVVIGAIALPIVVFVIGCVLVPSYVNSFIVKPNELGRETPFIEANIAATRRAFGLDRIDTRQFEARPSLQNDQLNQSRGTFENVRLWDWEALRDTLRQIQEIRTYYDFGDVDLDRYSVDGQTKQMMLAARELNVSKLPEQSRNWVNERLIYTHGYGVTMNEANSFSPEGLPQFILSNMPVESSSSQIKVTRPEIYFGEKTDTDVYVKTKQLEFDYPQGEENRYGTYQGADGVVLGSGLRRLLISAALGDLSKVPFSDAITPETRALIHRNIRERVNSIAPFLTYDPDPYVVVSPDGRIFWIMDAFTESSSYPYSRHHAVGDRSINYLRNSVKVVVDAYNGSVFFYVFDSQDPILGAYRAVFPTLFHDASEMPADLRAHVRYPETLLAAQGQVFGLYHTQNAKVFFQREDVWSVPRQPVARSAQKDEAEPIDPYFLLMQLPGERNPTEFVQILPFTPANRNNLIGWMAGRCDGNVYGSLLVYEFPKTRLVDGPLQIEARIDQNAQLSGQFTLWNQQGSKVRRGTLLVIPVGDSLLYAQPIFLQAERSPMPELRLIVLATQDRLVYGQSYQEALKALFGAGGALETAERGNVPEGQEKQTPPATVDSLELIRQASRDLADYKRLTAEGKFGEAGQKLESASKTLEKLSSQSAPGKP